jgi:ABC-type transport system involved in multi-copper enzyme maturation permease subunit
MRSVLRRAAAAVSAAITRAVEFIGRAEPLYGLAGPLFEKELRVSGRRARTYVLRAVYMLLLSGVVAMCWLSMVSVSGLTMPPVRYAYEMPFAGMTIISVIVWFQFCVLQLVAVVALSTSISEEIYQRTLGILMTTPVTSLQIVAGKLLSRLLQVVLLLAVSLPMLLVTQALGGVSWGFVLSALAITLATVVMAGSISMYFSISSRRSGILVILKTLAAMGILFFLLPWLWYEYGRQVTSQTAMQSVFVHSNPYLMLGWLTKEMYSPAAAPSVPVYWWLNVLAMLAVAALLFGLAVWRVRREAMRQLVGDPGGWLGSWRKRRAARSGRIRRVSGSPVVWRELRSSVLASKWLGVLGWLLVLGGLAGTYALAWDELTDKYGFGHIVYGIVLLIIVGLASAITTATGIAKEKEGGTWPLLLATPLDDRQIVLGKAVALARRCLPGCILVAFHFGLFVGLGYVHWVVLVHVAAITAGVVVVLTGSGLYFSTWVRRATIAVLMNLGFCLVLWLMAPMVVYIVGGMVVAMVSAITRLPYPPWLPMVYWSAHPLVQAGIAIAGGSGEENAAKALAELHYDWVTIKMGVFPVTFIVLAFMAIHVLAGWLLMVMAARRLRKKVF